ncbi:D-threonate kinase [Erwinia billingiae]|uniref:D-threonate kinase n=1 Tax=Erwinia billingiae TaxID=182337 RepID=UPI0022450010|nr:four-carbon acid sugar kinase family protein [Erwinia billingiae]MCX0498052.1 four-carbon acid sugar kinase family protein [Erwinia billingiae]
MTQRLWKTPVLVVADDFTGANDAGSGLAIAGARVNVLFGIEAQADAQSADVWVINTDSRAASAERAAGKTKAAVERWADIARDGWVFKKIDSTLRGNPGAEIEAAFWASGAAVALVVPAVPRLGRTTRQGNCYIHGVLLTDTEYASDPKTPVSHASVQVRLQEQSSLTCVEIPLRDVRQPDLQAILNRAMAQGNQLLVIDAENDEDLQRIMQAAAQLNVRPLLVGAAGLSDALSRHLAGKPVAPAVAGMGNAGPILAVVGSMSEIAQQQQKQLQKHHAVQLIDVDIESIFTHRADRTSLGQLAIKAMQAGQHCVIRTCQQAIQRQAIAGLCERYGLSRQQLGEQICDFLAALTREVLDEVAPAGLYLSGGDVAIAVAQGLGAEGFQIHGQVADCVPYGHLLNVKNDLLVLTKAGGFGDDTTLVEVFRFIEEKASE